MGVAIVAPFSSFALKVSLMVGLFSPMKTKIDGDQNTLKQDDKSKSAHGDTNRKKVKEEPQTKIENRSCLGLYLIGCFYKRGKAKEYRRLLAQSKSRLRKSLDLKRLIENQEFIEMAIRVLLTAKQIRVVKHISKKNLGISADIPDDKEPKKAQVRDEDPKERLHSLIECLAASDDILDRRLC